MNYDQEINKLVEAIKADKSIVQPWRNKAVSSLEESQAFVRMGKQMVYRFSNEEIPLAGKVECICELGTIDLNCLIHGGKK